MTRYDKLVRDRIPEIIEADGRQPVVMVLAPAEHRRALLNKLLEEAGEAAAAGDQVALAEELADILEVVRALAGAMGLSVDEVVQKADLKRAERGGFEKGIFLVEVVDAAR